MQHPIVGRIELTWMSLTLIDDSEQHIIVWIPEPGSPSAEALTVLSGLPADSAALDSLAAGSRTRHTLSHTRHALPERGPKATLSEEGTRGIAWDCNQG